MELLLVRHAQAEAREEFARTGQPDAERPLTAAGRKRMRRVVAGLRVALPSLALIATSPYRRALETAEILSAGYGGRAPVRVPLLAPGSSPREVLAWAVAHAGDGALAVVGHEPDLGRLASWLLAGEGADFVSLKKGGAALIQIALSGTSTHNALRWLLTPSQLRRQAP